MSIRTDLICERRELHTEDVSGADYKKEEKNGIVTETVEVKTDAAAAELQRDKGKYVTIGFPPPEALLDTNDLKSAIKGSLNALAPKQRSSVMVVGLGNPAITPDALGPLTADKILATRHLSRELKDNLGLSGLASVAVFSAGVIGKTGIEAAAALKSLCNVVSPDLVIVVDALACRRPERLCKTAQLCNTGIVAGSGVGNARQPINEQSLGVPVIAVGIPTVIDAATFSLDCGRQTAEPLFVTPKEIDRLMEITSTLLAESINEFLQPSLDAETLRMLM